MKKIDPKELFDVLSQLGIKCNRPNNAIITSVRELHDAMATMLDKWEFSVEVPDPRPDYESLVTLYAGKCFSSGGLLSENEKVFRFGFTLGGEVLFVSELEQGKVGLVFDLPEDEEDIDYEDRSGTSIRYWNLEIIDWLKEFMRLRIDLFD